MSPRPSLSRLVLALTVIASVWLLLTLPLAAAPPVKPEVSTTIVISQIYGGGGNAAATYKNDYIEPFNRGSISVSLNGWSVQYAAATSATGL